MNYINENPYGYAPTIRLDKQEARLSGRDGSFADDRYMVANKAHVHEMMALKVVAMMLLCMLAVFGVGAIFQIFGVSADASAGTTADTAQGEVIDPNKSTPKSEWKKGEMPYIYQTDPEWSNVEYANDYIETSGCGPTCASMVYTYLTGKKNKTPVEMAELSKRGQYIDQGLTSWTFISEGLERVGIKAEELSADQNVVRSQLSMGHPVICSVKKGDFTTDGHFIVLCGINNDGSIEIRDPNSYERSHQGWSLKRIIKQCSNIWACSLK